MVQCAVLQPICPIPRRLGGLILTLVALAILATSTNAAPNVLVILAQDLRASVAEDPAWMPHLQEIRKRGAGFANAHAANTQENASRTSLWTGLKPSSSGVTLDTQDWRRAVAMTNVRTIPEYFREQGYLTAAAGRVFYSNHGGPSSLLVTHEGGGRRGYELDGAWDHRFPEAGVQVPKRPERDAPNAALTEDGQVVDWAKGFLSQEHEKPFFAVVGLGSLALPRQIAKGYRERAQAISTPVADLEGAMEDLADVPPFPQNRFCDFRHPPATAIRDYGPAALMCDDMIASVINALDASAYGENTLVIITSTRGALLGEKRCGRGGALWQAATRVPLIVFGPGIKQVALEQQQAISLIDLYPTLCDWARLEAPVHLEGTSFRRCIGDLAYGVDRYVTTMSGSSGSPSYSIRDIDWHYIRYADGSEELYDHQQDHQERENLAVMTITQAERTRLASLIPPTTVGFSRLVDQVPQLQTEKESTQLWLQAGDVLPYQALPGLPGRGLFLEAAFQYNPRWHRDAVLVSWGTEQAGFSIHLEEGAPTLALYYKGHCDTFSGPALSAGQTEFHVVMAPEGPVEISIRDQPSMVKPGPYPTGFPGQPRNALLAGRVGLLPTKEAHPRRAPFDGSFQRFNLTLVSPQEVQTPTPTEEAEPTVLQAQPASAGL